MPTKQLYQSKAGAAHGILREQILDGTLAAGTILNQEQVAADLGMSTTPIREALRRLESEGLVLMPAHRDATVAPLDLGEFLLLFDVRAELDTMAAGYAAERHTDTDRKALQKAVGALERRPKNWIPTMRGFYSAVYHASHDTILIGHLERLWDQSRRYQHAMRDFSDTALFPRTYRDIVDAILEHDGPAAEKAMQKHLADAREAIKRTIATFARGATAS
ncbi:GntR family transcriptional regulator [Dactylosporangium cerinum]|uniref:GntR family transcriptional regulator n=1 Tax=Dactylosporangium cerinum TaxID=1434730 RepID=A0ABV9WD53_9ACTN